MNSRIHYCHGLESGPQGYKVRMLREAGFEVVAPDMQMSLLDVRAKHSALRGLLSGAALQHPPRQWFAAALERSREACVARQREALLFASPAPGLLIGSSWGGMIAARLIADGDWRGPAVLLCPALRLVERWMWPSGPIQSQHSAASIAQALGRLPRAQREQIILVHGDADQTVPLDDSRWLAQEAGLTLIVVPEGTHGLGRFVAAGELSKLAAQQLALAGEGAVSVSAS